MNSVDTEQATPERPDLAKAKGGWAAVPEGSLLFLASYTGKNDAGVWFNLSSAPGAVRLMLSRERWAYMGKPKTITGHLEPGQCEVTIGGGALWPGIRT